MYCKSAAGLLIVLGCLGCEGEEPTDSLVGTWRLVSWVQADPAGELVHPYGEAPEGQIMYTTDGQMSAQLMNPGADLAEATGSGAEGIIGQAMRSYFAYYGTYTVDASAGTVTHHVRGSLAPTWIGTDQVRAFEFLSANRLQLSAVINADDKVARATRTKGRQVLVWERID